MPAPLHPQTASLIEMFNSAGLPPLAEGTVEDARARIAGIPQLLGAGPEVGQIRDISIPSPDGDVPARVYEPERDAIATIVYMHGGGWVVGGLDDFDAMMRWLVKDSDCKVVNIDYRLAPEHRFPAAADDAFAAVKWVAANEQTGPLIVGGDSAGGNLAAVCAIRARDEGGPEIAMQILCYPVTDHDFETESYREHGDNPLLSRADMEWFWDHYVPSHADRALHDASPLRAKDLSNLPPAYVVQGDHDVLRDEVLAYVERLKGSGVEVDLHFYDDQAHGFVMMVNFIEPANDAIRELAGAIRERVGASAR